MSLTQIVNEVWQNSNLKLPSEAYVLRKQYSKIIKISKISNEIGRRLLARGESKIQQNVLYGTLVSFIRWMWFNINDRWFLFLNFFFCIDQPQKKSWDGQLESLNTERQAGRHELTLQTRKILRKMANLKIFVWWLLVSLSVLPLFFIYISKIPYRLICSDLVSRTFVSAPTFQYLTWLTQWSS